MDWNEHEYEDLLRQFQPRMPGVPRGMSPVRFRKRGWWLAAAAVLLLTISIAVVPLISRLGAPAVVEIGEVVRANGGGRVIRLRDGSRVEMRSDSEFSLEQASDGIRIRLISGSIIVNAAKQLAGHLYVQTKDVVVSVVGTVFLVNAEQEGSRVGVIQGEVRVQGETSKNVFPGEQVTTNPSLEPQPMLEEITWSRNLQAHLALLQQQSAASLAAIAAQRPLDTGESFEVASVKPVDPATATPPGFAQLPPLPCRGVIQIDPTRFLATRVTLYRLIALGYGRSCPAFPPHTETDHISGGPTWIKSDAFDVQGVIPAGYPSYTQRQLADGNAPKLQMMIRTLLAERFHLALHREMRDMPVYNLVVVKEGRLKASEEPSPEAAPAAGQGSQAGPPRGVLAFGVDPPKGKVFIEATGIPISALVNLFQGQVGRLVVDKTDLKRLYEFPRMEIDVGAFEIDGPSVWPSIAAEALPQLGLKLEPARGPVEVLVIDRADKPTEN